LRVFCKLFQSLAAVKWKALRLKLVRTFGLLTNLLDRRSKTE